jgi:hypothetical protein
MERAPVKTIKVRMSRAYAAYKKGEVVEVPEQQAQSMIAWEYATLVSEQPLLDSQKQRKKQP